MLNHIIAYCLTNRVLVLAVTVVLVIYGARQAAELPIDVFPNLNRPTVTIMVEDEGATGALGRSRELVSGRWGSVFGVLVVLFILQFIISAILGAIIGAGSILGGTALSAGQLAASQVASTVTSILVQPFLAVVITVVYFDLRVRPETVDVD